MKMKYVTVKSGLESVNGAYLGQFVSNGTSTLDEVAEKMCKDRPAVDEPEAKLAVRALAAEIREQVGVNLNRVNAGPVSFEPAISGSLPAMDSALGPENELYVNVVASDALQKEIAAIVPTRDSASAIAVKMDNVEDLASHGPKIVGTKEFVVTGFNLSARQDGEGMALLHLDGTSAAEVTVKEEDGMGQRVNAQLVASVASADDARLFDAGRRGGELHQEGAGRLRGVSRAARAGNHEGDESARRGDHQGRPAVRGRGRRSRHGDTGDRAVHQLGGRQLVQC